MSHIRRQNYVDTFVKLYKSSPEVTDPEDLTQAMPERLQLEFGEDFREGDRPEVLVDPRTQEMIDDPNSLFNLTLTTYPKQQTIYLGRLFL